MTTSRKRILIIDDDLHMLFVWRAAMTHLPHECIVDTAQNGNEALDKLASLGDCSHERYDLIVTDLVMPYMNGHEFTHRVRMLYGDVPIVWITSHHNGTIEADAQELGVYCCLDKPISLTLMRQVVWEALEAAKTQHIH